MLATLSSFASEDNAQAKGLLKYFSRYKTVLLVACLLDVHEIIGMLSLSLQRENFTFGELEPLIDGTVEKIQEIQGRDGAALTEMRQNITISEQEEQKKASLGSEVLTHYSEQAETQFSRIRDSFVCSLQKNIKNRFPKQDGHIFRDLSTLLEPDVFNSSEEHEINEALEHVSVLYGNEKTTKIVLDDHTEETRVGPVLDKEMLRKEWPM